MKKSFINLGPGYIPRKARVCFTIQSFFIVVAISVRNLSTDRLVACHDKRKYKENTK